MGYNVRLEDNILEGWNKKMKMLYLQYSVVCCWKCSLLSSILVFQNVRQLYAPYHKHSTFFISAHTTNVFSLGLRMYISDNNSITLTVALIFCDET